MFGFGSGIPFSRGADVGRYEKMLVGWVEGVEEGGGTYLLSAHIVSAFDSGRQMVVQSPDWFLRTHCRSQATISSTRG